METFNETCKNYALAKSNRHINRMKLDSANSKTETKNTQVQRKVLKNDIVAINVFVTTNMWHCPRLSFVSLVAK